MLEIILGFKVPKVSVHVEHSILISSDFRIVRLDVYASDELKVGYDIEAQNDYAGNLAKMLVGFCHPIIQSSQIKS